MIELFDGSVEGAFGGEGAYVQFVDHRRRQWTGLPTGICPREGVVIHHPRRAVDAVRLPRRARIREWAVAVHDKGVVGAHTGRVYRHLPPAAVYCVHGQALPTV